MSVETRPERQAEPLTHTKSVAHPDSQSASSAATSMSPSAVDHAESLLSHLLKRHKLQSLAEQHDAESTLRHQVIQLHAQVMVMHAEGVFTAKVSDGQELFPVKKAFSCLHEVQIGDQVLVSGSIHDGFYILAIIERPETSGETVLQLGEQVRLEARDLKLVAQSHQLEVQRYQLLAQQYQVDSTYVTYRGQAMQYYAVKLEENYAQAQRFVAGSDSVQALNFDYRAEQTARIHGVNTFINGEKLLKSDGQLMMVG